MAVSKPAAEALDRAGEAIREAVRISFAELDIDRANEREYADLWVSQGKRIGSFFLSEAERTGNEQLARYIRRNLTKTFIFS